MLSRPTSARHSEGESDSGAASGLGKVTADGGAGWLSSRKVAFNLILGLGLRLILGLGLGLILHRQVVNDACSSSLYAKCRACERTPTSRTRVR